jgi:hypothetical protein
LRQAAGASFAELSWLSAPRGAHNASLIALKAQILALVRSRTSYDQEWRDAVKNADAKNTLEKWTIRDFKPDPKPAFTEPLFPEGWFATPFVTEAKDDLNVLKGAVDNISTAWPPSEGSGSDRDETERQANTYKGVWESHGKSTYGHMVHEFFKKAVELRNLYARECMAAFKALVAVLNEPQVTDAQITEAMMVKRGDPSTVIGGISQSGTCVINLAWTPPRWYF